MTSNRFGKIVIILFFTAITIDLFSDSVDFIHLKMGHNRSGASSTLKEKGKPGNYQLKNFVKMRAPIKNQDLIIKNAFVKKRMNVSLMNMTAVVR